MGDHSIDIDENHKARAQFIKHLLDDITALEIMLEKGLIEDDIERIGAEQEFCLINNNWRPAKNAEEIIAAVNDPHFTTELAKYNVEINLDPQMLNKSCFSVMEKQLRELLGKAENEALKRKTKTILTGILPTISKHELEFEFLTPMPRYIALNNTMKKLRNGDFHLSIKGVDELNISHESVLFEACNTSFQMHLQIPPQDFTSSYNWAQAIAGPVLGISTNSPLLLGRELWSETRIALFQQSIDTRISSYALKDQLPRVTFGSQWATGTVADIFKHDVALFKIIITKAIEEDSLQKLIEGNIPNLDALKLHNGTVYRWNRPCYGTSNGKAHVRIENRYIPSGPTVVDEMANFAFWVGLMKGRPKQFDDLANTMEFREVKANFLKAAKLGKNTVMRWNDQDVMLSKLVKKTLLPMAYTGLKNASIDTKHIEKYLGIIEQRADGYTGAQWSIRNFRKMRSVMKKDDALLGLTKAIYKFQQSEKPIHEWPDLKTRPKVHESAFLLEHVMSTQLFTVKEFDLANLATSVMRWKNIHHVPVENDEGKLCGLLTWTHMKRNQNKKEVDPECLVADIMITEVISVQPKTTIKEGIRLMKENEIGCLPIVTHDEVIGIVTVKDVIDFDNDRSI